MEYLIREFQAGDIDVLIELCHKHATHERVQYDRHDKHRLLGMALLNPNPRLFCWVVVVKGAVVGYATYTFEFSTWHAHQFLHLDCLFIDEAYRGLGIGAEIIRRLQAVAKNNNCVNLQWQTPSFNVDAIRFYNRIGASSMDKKRFFLASNNP
jgi:GNAT superfamily N-acetyltransferase